MNRDVCQHFNPTDQACRECAAVPVVNQQLTTEPVAWVEPKWLDPDTRGWPSDSFASQPIEGWLPLYTAPTPRQWVGLTDEDVHGVIAQVLKTITGGSNTFTASANSVWTTIIQSVEAKIQEKNI